MIEAYIMACNCNAAIEYFNKCPRYLAESRRG